MQRPEKTEVRSLEAPSSLFGYVAVSLPLVLSHELCVWSVTANVYIMIARLVRREPNVQSCAAGHVVWLLQD